MFSCVLPGNRSTFMYPLTPFEAEGLTPPTYIPSIDGVRIRANHVKSAFDPPASPKLQEPEVKQENMYVFHKLHKNEINCD